MRSYRTLRRYAQQGADGKDWYNDTVPVVEAVAAGLGVSPKYLADVLAIMSPRVHVTRNIRIALTYITGGGYAGVMPGVVQSLRYYEDTTHIRGPKTSAFARALRGDKEAIVLDVWMGRALNVPQEKLGTKRVMQPANALVRRVGNSLGWAPAEVQAAIWTHWVRTHRRSDGSRVYAQAPSFAALLLAPREQT